MSLLYKSQVNQMKTIKHWQISLAHAHSGTTAGIHNTILSLIVESQPPACNSLGSCHSQYCIGLASILDLVHSLKWTLSVPLTSQVIFHLWTVNSLNCFIFYLTNAALYTQRLIKFKLNKGIPNYAKGTQRDWDASRSQELGKWVCHLVKLPD